MTGKIERDETLEEQGVLRVPSSQETEQTRCRAPKEADIPIQIIQPRFPLPSLSSIISSGRRERLESRDAPIGDHIKDGPKLARLVQRPRRHPVHGVQQAGHAVQ